MALDRLDIFAVPLLGLFVRERGVFNGQFRGLRALRLVQSDLAEVAVVNTLLAQILLHAVVVFELLSATSRSSEPTSALNIDEKTGLY